MLPMHTDLTVMLDESGIMAGQKALLSPIVGSQCALTDELRFQTIHDLVTVHLMGFVQAFQPQPGRIIHTIKIADEVDQTTRTYRSAE